MFCHNMSNETLSSGYNSEAFVQTNERNADNYMDFVKKSLANNDLIIENILKWLKPSQLIKCSQVCKKWQIFVQLLRSKRKFFSHLLLYFLLLPKQQMIKFKDQDFMRTSLEDIINSLNLFIARNHINEFKLIIIFSKLEFKYLQTLIENRLFPNDCKVIHINTENEIIGTQVGFERPLKYMQSQLDMNLLAGISGLFMSRDFPGLQVNVYNDSQIFDMKSDENLKCVLVFHIWRSFYGHFSQLKTDNEYFEHIENFVHNSKNLSFSGITVDRIAISNNNCNETETHENLSCFLDNICCVTFSGDKVSAYSLVLDLNDLNVDKNIIKLRDELNCCSSVKTETIGFIFSENLLEITLKIKNLFENIRFIGCSGVVHGYNNTSIIDSSKNESLFFKKGKCVLAIICIDKS